ncbi:MAG: ATP-dependent Clp protease ATP-binding subunit [Acholeplasmatales bacterium]|nr:ATP-dependent Clp protease ATP-binding subunit [Acholeplasmatales bacterium]
MEYDLNDRAQSIINLARIHSQNRNISTMGTEFLILAMYETEDSLCRFLLSEYECTHEEIEEITNNIFILRKKNKDVDNTLIDILNQAKLLSGDNKISEEHIFMSILMNKNCIACYVLEELDLNIDELIKDVKEIYDFNNNSEDLGFIKNLSKAAKNDELASFVNRDNYLSRIDVIMNRKYKSNPLLIGNAGVGKTAIVEGYAKLLCERESDISILSLNLTSMLSGTRYRGDFEERFDKFVKEIATRKNVVVFIDEIHVIMGTGTTEGNLDVANMLKPFLARNDIRVIGATTLDEYHKTISHDKALSRRFQPIFISEPTIDETRNILKGIRNDYEKFHKCEISDDVLEYLLIQSDKKITRRFRPDKCIDVLDDIMSYNHIHNISNVSKDDVDKALLGFIGNSSNNDYKAHFKEINKYKWLYEMDLLDSKPLFKILYEGNNIGLDMLITDCINTFRIGNEALLEIDLSAYKDNASLTSLIGAPPGYVGYDDEGILSKHLLEYPMSLLVFKSFDKASLAIKTFIQNTISRGSFIDQRGRVVSLQSTIVIVEGIKDKSPVGFNSEVNKNQNFNEIIIYSNDYKESLNNKYVEALHKINYEISFDFDINYDNCKEVNEYLYSFISNNSTGKYLIKKNQIM